ncbi:MAG: inorganic diphosphatase [Pseudomonadota bacterium]
MTVDRRFGSKHPRHASIEYGLNYGFVAETMAADGCEIDAYIVGVLEPLDSFEGECIGIIHRYDDVEDKLIVALFGQNFSDEEIAKMTDFQEQFFKSTLIR